MNELITRSADDARVLVVFARRRAGIVPLARQHVRLVAATSEPTHQRRPRPRAEVGPGARLAALQPQLAADDARVPVVELLVADGAPARSVEELDAPRPSVRSARQAQRCRAGPQG